MAGSPLARALFNLGAVGTMSDTELLDAASSRGATEIAEAGASRNWWARHGEAMVLRVCQGVARRPA